MTPSEEEAYEQGSRTVWVGILAQCCRALGYDDLVTQKARWIREREDIIAVLRRACDEHGDNNWTSSDHLGDVIEKHLRYIDAKIDNLIEQR